MYLSGVEGHRRRAIELPPGEINWKGYQKGYEQLVVPFRPVQTDTNIREAGRL